MLSGRGLCDELITRLEESYRLWFVVVCNLENLKNEEAMTRVGSQRQKNIIIIIIIIIICTLNSISQIQYRFRLPATVIIKSTIFSGMTPCCLVD